MGWRGAVGLAAMLISAAVPAGAGEPGGAPRTTAAGLARGAELFRAECAGCHGLEGDGNGVADPEMQPRPRDLRSGKFKLRSTMARSPITQAELVTTITRGIPGTSMPSFGFLDEADRETLAEFVASLARLPEEDRADDLDIPPEPAASAERLAEGERLYADLGCPACHGDEGRGDGGAAPYLKDEWGSRTQPRDLTLGSFKGGDSGVDLYRRFAIGMPGTPMPSYADLIGPEQMWSLVMYVQSLHRPRVTPAADLVERGRMLFEEKACLACHSLPAAAEGDGRRGGAVGPPLDRASKKLDPAWVERYLRAPRAAGKIYPSFPYRMPDLDLDEAQVGAVRAYIASVLGRQPKSSVAPTPVVAPAARLRGRVLYAAACASCHTLGTFAASAAVEQRGPDLDRAAERLDYAFVVAHAGGTPSGEQFEAGAGHGGLRTDDARAVAEFIWSESRRTLQAPRRGGEKG